MMTRLAGRRIATAVKFAKRALPFGIVPSAALDFRAPSGKFSIVQFPLTLCLAM